MLSIFIWLINIKSKDSTVIKQLSDRMIFIASKINKLIKLINIEKYQLRDKELLMKTAEEEIKKVSVSKHEEFNYEGPFEWKIEKKLFFYLSLFFSLFSFQVPFILISRNSIR